MAIWRIGVLAYWVIPAGGWLAFWHIGMLGIGLCEKNTLRLCASARKITCKIAGGFPSGPG